MGKGRRYTNAQVYAAWLAYGTQEAAGLALNLQQTDVSKYIRAFAEEKGFELSRRVKVPKNPEWLEGTGLTGPPAPVVVERATPIAAHQGALPLPEHFEPYDLTNACSWCEDPHTKAVVFTLMRVMPDGEIKSAGAFRLCERDWKRLTGQSKPTRRPKPELLRSASKQGLASA